MAQQRMNDDAFDKDKNSNNSRALAPDEWDLINTRVHFASLWDTQRQRRHWNEKKWKLKKTTETYT